MTTRAERLKAIAGAGLAAALSMLAMASRCGAQDPTLPPPAVPAGFTAVEIAVRGERAGTIRAYLKRPATQTGRGAPTPVPVVIGLHGCNGLFNLRGKLSALSADWADRLTAAGYVVAFPDSFSARGYRQVCTLSEAERPIRPQHRARDAAAVAAWLGTQPFADRTRLAIIGWSHGGSSVLWALGQRFAWPQPELAAAIAFYPGCRAPADKADWLPRRPVTILIGSDDDWTPPASCRVLAERTGVRLIEYPGAVHGFDAPGSPRRTLTGIGLARSSEGRVQVGTDPAARAAAIEVVMKELGAAFSHGKAAN